MPDIPGSGGDTSRPKESEPKKLRSARRGVAMILMGVSFVMVGGMIGLGIDVGVMYFLKARLSQAIDGGALAGARSLSRGADIGAQRTSAQTTALKFFKANFPDNFWGCTIVTPAKLDDISVTEDANKTRHVTITATVTAPLYFLRLLGFSTTNIGAFGQAARRDANIMFILDRSGSMKDAIDALAFDAEWLVGQFAPGRDKVGLVTFGGTYNLIKPTTAFLPTVVNAIETLKAVGGTIHVNGTTNHAQPLWIAYQALAEANEPGALNAIVFFTDGQPNTILANWQSVLSSPTTCNNGVVKGVYNPVIGYALAYQGNTATGGLFGTSSPLPPYQPQSLSPGAVATAYVAGAYDLFDSVFPDERTKMATSSGCKFYGPSDPRNPPEQLISSDLKGIPDRDIYGNLTNAATKYKSVSLNSFSATNLVAAAFNAGDYAAQRMRLGQLGTPTPIVPLVDCISLNTGGPIDSVYMKRLANAVDSQIYDATKPTGLYVYAQTTADLQGAFVQIASQILHLSL